MSMKRKIYGIFVAAGSGTRMGGDTPKQFMSFEGKPVLQRTLETFMEALPEMKVITVLPHNYFQTWKDFCAINSFFCPQTLVAGGLTRFQSVRQALSKVPDDVIVFIHDGVRPFTSTELIRSMAERMEDCKALIPAMPVTDTLRSTNPEIPDPDRSCTVAVQTPQFFLSEGIKKAYSAPYRTSFTDDASVAAAAGIKVDIFPGDRFNIKITTPEDLIIGKAILSMSRP